jgi:putative drug exporter of the RND superfamily
MLRALVLVLVAGVWLGIGSVGGPLIGRLSQVQENDNANFLPASAESTELAALSRRFSSGQTFPAFVVVERAGGITPADVVAARAYAGWRPGRSRSTPVPVRPLGTCAWGST